MLQHCYPVSARLTVNSICKATPAGRYGGWRSLHGGGDDSSRSRTTWRKPEVGRLKLNFDGSSKHASRRASIGGVYRDHEGGFVLGYAERIGKATSSVAELAALRRGLELALENGWLNISIEGDAKTVVDVVRNRASVRVEEDPRQCEEIAALLLLLDDGDMAVSHTFAVQGTGWRTGSRNLGTAWDGRVCGVACHRTRCLGTFSATPRVNRARVRVETFVYTLDVICVAEYLFVHILCT
jgi:hypothetical protein